MVFTKNNNRKSFILWQKVTSVTILLQLKRISIPIIAIYCTRTIVLYTAVFLRIFEKFFPFVAKETSFSNRNCVCSWNSFYAFLQIKRLRKIKFILFAIWEKCFLVGHWRLSFFCLGGDERNIPSLISFEVFWRLDAV